MSLAASPFFAQRYHQLDFLRFVGAVVVAMYHFNEITVNPYRNCFNGAAVVVIFFILSGFVLSYKYLHGDELKPTYFLARILRLWIPFAVVLLYTQLWWRPVLYVDLAANHFPLASYSPLSMFSVMIGPSWTLFPELICSMIAPLMVLVARRSTMWLVAYAAVFYFVPNGDLYISFSAGVLMAKHIDVVNRLPVWAARLMLYTFIVVEFSPILNISPSLCYITSVMVVWAFIRLPMLGSHPVLRFMGRLSYPIYLCHWPIMLAVGAMIVQSSVTKPWAWMALYLAATLVASVVLLPVEWLAINALRLKAIDFRRSTSETKSTL